VINVIVAAGLSLVFHAMKLPDGKDITRSSDYGADENDPKVAQIQREYPLGEPEGPAF
jgi:SSS family solute:Na+ symporter